jgi:enoyl-CoA hydratase/carnithine racemase
VGSIGYDTNGPIARITIQGDNELNLLSLDMVDALSKALVRFRDDRSLAVAVIAGQGSKAFSAGGDLKGPITTTPELFTPQGNRDWVWWPREEPRAATERLITLEIDKPVIAEIRGYCLGLALMMLCQVTDIRVAGASATFGFTETQQGLSGGAASSQILRHFTPGLGMYMALTGERISAHEAMQAGLLAKVVPDNELRATVDTIAAQIGELPIEVLKSEKEGALRTRDKTRQEAFRLATLLYTIHVQQEGAYDRAASFLTRNNHGSDGGGA